MEMQGIGTVKCRKKSRQQEEVNDGGNRQEFRLIDKEFYTCSSIFIEDGKLWCSRTG